MALWGLGGQLCIDNAYSQPTPRPPPAPFNAYQHQPGYHPTNAYSKPTPRPPPSSFGVPCAAFAMLQTFNIISSDWRSLLGEERAGERARVGSGRSRRVRSWTCPVLFPAPTARPHDEGPLHGRPGGWDWGMMGELEVEDIGCCMLMYVACCMML
jgi:hypothetical protein